MSTPSFSMLNAIAAEVGESRMILMCEEYLAHVREKRAGILPPSWNDAVTASLIHRTTAASQKQYEQTLRCWTDCSGAAAAGVPSTPERTPLTEAARALRLLCAQAAPARALPANASVRLAEDSWNPPRLASLLRVAEPAAHLPTSAAAMALNAAIVHSPKLGSAPSPLLSPPEMEAQAPPDGPSWFEMSDEAFSSAFSSLASNATVRDGLEKRIADPAVAPEAKARLKNFLRRLIPTHPLFCDLHRSHAPGGPSLGYSRNSSGRYSTFAPLCSGCEVGESEAQAEAVRSARSSVPSDEDLYA